MTGSPSGESAKRRLEPRTVIVMGVAGSGKSTVGRALAGALGWRFCEGDMHHTVENIEKMAQGVPLTDEDRAPWLASLRDFASECYERGESLVIACSALKVAYRDLLGDGDRVLFVFLRGDPVLLKSRLESRSAHYMGANMLESQLEALEEPSDALIVDVSNDVATILETIVSELDLPVSSTRRSL